MKPFVTNIPTGSLIENALDRVDYLDAFAIRLPEIYAVPIHQVVRQFFYALPNWVRLLLGFRELLAGLVGLKTSRGMDVAKQLREFKGEVGESIALFHVLGRKDNEILTGEDDSHLDFRLSFFGERIGDHFEVTLATTVRVNGWLGKVYWFFVRPFHRYLVPLMLKLIARRLMDKPRAFQANV